MAKKKDNEVLGAFALIIGAPMLLANWMQGKIGIPQSVTYSVLAIVVIVCAGAYFAHRHRKFSAVQIANVDSMGGVEFERYLQKLLTSQGYRVNMTPPSGDLGVDLVAARGSDRFAIQVKRHNSKVSRRAISDAVAGMRHYRCDRAMVITNSHFTSGAITLARSTDCMLVDRDTLAEWILQLQTPAHTPPNHPPATG